MVRLQEQNIEDIARSKRTSFSVPGRDHVYTIGELHAILYDLRSQEPVDGLHRSATPGGWKKRENITTFDDLDFYVKRLHATSQRAPSQAEHEELFEAICEELAKLGMEERECGQFLRDHISNFGKSYTYSLIPKRFKKETSPTGPRVRQPDSPPESVTDKESGIELTRSTESISARAPGLTNCPNCNAALRITSANSVELA